MNQSGEFFLLSLIVTKDKPGLIAGLFHGLTECDFSLQNRYLLIKRQAALQAENESVSAERAAAEAIRLAELDASCFTDINITIDKILAAIGKAIKDPKTPIVVNYLMAQNPDPRTAIIKIESYFRHANKQTKG